MTDLISRADAIEAVIAQRHKAELSDYNFALGLAEDAIRHLPSAEAEWIPVEWHYITDEERKENGYPKDWGVLMDCDMPLDEQEILVTTTSGRVEKDVCYLDGEFSLDSGWDWVDDILAWMPLPKPYREESEVEE